MAWQSGSQSAIQSNPHENRFRADLLFAGDVQSAQYICAHERFFDLVKKLLVVTREFFRMTASILHLFQLSYDTCYTHPDQNKWTFLSSIHPLGIQYLRGYIRVASLLACVYTMRLTALFRHLILGRTQDYVGRALCR